MTLKNVLFAAALVTVPAASFANDWTGAYAGAQIGGSDIDVDGAAEVDGDGYLFGLGYDFPVADNITIGGELLQHQFDDYNGTDLDVGVTTFKARVAFNF